MTCSRSKHRRDLHSSGPCVTPKMKELLQERGHEVNAKGVCFRAGSVRGSTLIETAHPGQAPQ